MSNKIKIYCGQCKNFKGACFSPKGKFIIDHPEKEIIGYKQNNNINNDCDWFVPAEQPTCLKKLASSILNYIDDNSY